MKGNYLTGGLGRAFRTSPVLVLWVLIPGAISALPGVSRALKLGPPPGWSAEAPERFGPTRLGAFPPVTQAEGEVLLSAIDRPGGGAILVVRSAERLRADTETKDALAVAAPAALATGWGTGFRTLWADVRETGGRRVIQLQGTFAASSGERTALVTWVPGGEGHHIVLALAPTADADTLRDLVSPIVAALPAEEKRAGAEAFTRALVAVSFVVAVAVAGAFALRRRRGTATG